jgi:hypothetical protein
MTRRVGRKGIAGVIHPYPTRADAVRKVGDRFNRARLTPRVQALLKSRLSWTD